MKINWKVRFKNKEWLITFIGVVTAFIYQLLGLFGVVAPIGEDTIVQSIGIFINLLCGLGIIIDPTTQGVRDSERALCYDEPNR